jgi:hypothetical protein
MRTLIVSGMLSVSLLGLGACTTYDDYGYGYGDSYASVGSGYAPDACYYAYSNCYSRYGNVFWHDSYYDDFYGPVFGGYWATDGFFYYQTGLGSLWLRDDGRHFRHDNFRGSRFYRSRDTRGDRPTGWEGDSPNWRGDRGYQSGGGQSGGQQAGGGQQDQQNNGRGRGGNRGGQSGGNPWNPPAQSNPAPSGNDDGDLAGAPRRGERKGGGRTGWEGRTTTPQSDTTPAPAPSRSRGDGGGRGNSDGGSRGGSDGGGRSGGFGGSTGWGDKGDRGGGRGNRN